MEFFAFKDLLSWIEGTCHGFSDTLLNGWNRLSLPREARDPHVTDETVVVDWNRILNFILMALAGYEVSASKEGVHRDFEKPEQWKI